MNKPKFREKPLSKQHNRQDFDCGDRQLNEFLQRYARQSHEKQTVKTYVVTEVGSEKIIGFYSITISTLTYDSLPKSLQKGLGRYAVPTYLLARLAVDKAYQGQGIGGTLLVKALARCKRVAEEVGGIGLLIEAKNEAVADWYQLFGAMPLPDQPLTLIIPFSVLD